MANLQRTVADYTLGQLLEDTLFGQRFAAHSASRRDLVALVVDQKLAAHPRFRGVLLDQERCKRLTGLVSESVVATIDIVEDRGELIVVTAPPKSARTLKQLLASESVLPARLVASIARSVMRGLAAMHGRGLTHGTLHPRNIIVADDGTVFLDNLALSAALAASLAHGIEDQLWRELREYLAPELLTGAHATPPSDVFAGGALVFSLLAGTPPPASLRTTPAVERVVFRAIDREIGRRYRDGRDLLEELLEAFSDDNWDFATDNELAQRMAPGRASSEGGLDDATEDLLASLGSLVGNTPMRPSMEIRAEATASRQASRGLTVGGLDALLADLDQPSEAVVGETAELRGQQPAMAVPRARSGSTRPPPTPPGPTGFALGASGVPAPRLPMTPRRSGASVPPPITAPAVVVAPISAAAAAQAAADALAAVASLDLPSPTASTPLVAAPNAEPALDDDASPIADVAVAIENDEPAKVLAAVVPTTSAATVRVRHVSKPVELPAGVTQLQRVNLAAVPAAPPVDLSLPVPKLRRSGLGPLFLLLSLLGVAAIGWVLISQDDRRSEAEQAQARAVEKAAAETARQQALLPVEGTIRIRSNPDQATVWLQLGRTPLTSMPVSTGGLVQLRVEVEGHIGQDVAVLANDWHGSDALKKSDLAVELLPGTSSLPADPGKPEAVAGQAFSPGRGIINVTSKPSGAVVWLLVGTTNSMELSGIEAARDYELRVAKDGYLPGYVSLPAEAWRDGGNEAIPIAAAPKKTLLERMVELVPAEIKPAKRKR